MAWRGAKPPGATRAVTWPQAAFGIYSRCFLHCLPMATGGVSHLLQVLFGLFCSWMEQVAEATCILCKKLQRTRGGTWRFPRVSRAKSGILWLSGGTTRVKWRGASYLQPGPIYDLGASLAPRAAAHLLKKRKGPVGATGLTCSLGAPPHLEHLECSCSR